MAEIIQWPGDLLAPGECRPNLNPFTRTGGRSLGGVAPAVRSDLGFWSIDLVGVPVHSRDQRRTWSAIRQNLSGMAGLIVVPAWSRDTAPYALGAFEPPPEIPHDDDALFNDGSPYVQGAISVVTEGNTALGATVIKLRIINAAQDLTGVRFSFNHALYETGPAIAIDGDVWTVPISPSVREFIPAASELEFDRPTCLCHLAEDRGMDGGVDAVPFERRSVSFVEATDYWNALAIGAIVPSNPIVPVLPPSTQISAVGNFENQAYQRNGAVVGASSAFTFTRASVGTYFGADGLLKTAAANEPRYTHDPLTGAPQGLMFEEGSANFLKWGNDFSNAAWVKESAIVTPGAAIGIDGGLSMSKIVAAAVSGEHFVEERSIATDASSVQCFSCYVAAAGHSKLTLRVFSLGSGVLNATYGLSSKTHSASAVGDAQLATSGMTHVGNNIYRCWVSGIPSTAGGSALWSSRISVLNASGANVFPGDGTSGIYVSRAQHEYGTTPTSYIPTTSAPVTRAADSLILNADGVNNWTLYQDDMSAITVAARNGSQPVTSGLLPRRRLLAYIAEKA